MRADGGQFPIGEMGSKADRRLAAFHDRVEAFLRMRRIGDDVFGLGAETFDAELVEMREFDGDAAEIVPHPAEDFLDLRVRFFRKRCAQIIAAKPMLFEQRPDLAHQPAGEIRHAPRSVCLMAPRRPIVSAPATLSSKGLKLCRIKTRR